ncbi:MAG: hypothetical protein ACK58T_30950, partial [Phycisphaerae bacterium]
SHTGLNNERFNEHMVWQNFRHWNVIKSQITKLIESPGTHFYTLDSSRTQVTSDVRVITDSGITNDSEQTNKP